MIFRLAIRLAFTGDPRHRWRQFSLAVGCFAAALLALVGIGVVSANSAQHHRLNSRMPRLASDGGVSISIVPRSDVVDGQRYVTLWIATGEAGSAIAPPPGLPRLPVPGEAFLSPRLMEMAGSNPTFAERFPRRERIGPAGLVSGDELLAYVGLPAERVPERHLEVAGFGVEDPARGLWVDLHHLPPRSLVAAGATLFCIVPAAILLAITSNSLSAVRNHRFSVLAWLGAPWQWRAALSAIETFVLALPGSLLAGAVWILWAGRLGSLPVVWMDPIPGDLALAPLTVGLVVFGVATVSAALAVSGTALSGLASRLLPRPAAAAESVAGFKLYPLVLSGLLLSSRPWVSEAQSDALLVIGMALMLVGVPLAAPVAVRGAGSAVVAVRSVPTLLAGRRLAWLPVRNSRPHVAAATLVALILTVAGYQKLTDSEIQPRSQPPVAFANVSLAPASEDDIERFNLDVRPALSAVLREEANQWIVGASCEQLAQHVPGLGCNQDRPDQFGPGGEGQLRMALGLPEQLGLVLAPDLRRGQEWHQHAAGVPATHEHIVGQSASSHEHDGLLLVDASRSGELLEEVAGTAAAKSLPGSSVVGFTRFRLYYPPSWAWAIAGLGLASAVLALSTAIPIIERLMETSSERQVLTGLGVSPRRMRLLESLLFAIPYGVVVGCGLAGGVVSCWLLVSASGAPMPWAVVAIVAATTAVIGLMCAFVLALGRPVGLRPARD